jgi:hypothetical protein
MFMDLIRILKQSRGSALGLGMAGLLLGACGLTACQTQQQQVQQREDLLSAAGFIVRPANTPERQAMLNRLPPHKFVQRVNGDVVHYVYADPLVCGCLYVGTQQAYNQYKANQLQQHLADERQMAADTYSDAAWNWGAWGPWTPAGPGFGFIYGPAYGW